MAARELPLSVALGALSAAAALAFGGVFASTGYLAAVLGAALLPHALGWATRRATRSGAVSALVAVAGLLLYAVVVAGSDLTGQFRAGWRTVRTGTAPIAPTTPIVLIAVIAVWAVASVADDFAFRRDGSIATLAPSLLVIIWIQALTRSADWLPSTLLFGGAAVAFLALQHQFLLVSRRTRIGTARGGAAPRLVVGAAVGGVVACLVGAGVAEAVPGIHHPIVTVGPQNSGAGASYSSAVPPVVDVGDHLRDQTPHELFTVVASQPDYWRQVSLDQYSPANGGMWTLNASGNDVGDGLHGTTPRDGLRQTFQIGPLDEKWMPAAYKPVSVNRSDLLVVRSSATLVTRAAHLSGLRYTVDSSVPAALPTAAEQAATAAPLPASLVAETRLPPDVPVQVTQTAQSVAAQFTTPYDKAKALRDYFRNSFVYDTSVRLGDDGNAMVQFLNTRRGFCVQFAATYAVMARSLGIPARLAVGFTSGTLVRGSTYSVSTTNAHTWPEVWLAGLGWTHLFDPTPPGPAAGASHLPVEPPVSSLRTPTPTTTPVVPTTAPAPGGSGASGGPGSQPVPTPGPRVQLSHNNRPPSSGPPWRDWALTLGIVLGVLIVATFATLAALRARRRAWRRSGADATAQVAGAWAEALDHLTDAGVTWPPANTPLEVPGALPDRIQASTSEPLTALAGRYTSARYGSRPPTPETVQRAWADAAAVRKGVDAALGVGERLRTRLRYRGVEAPPEPAEWSGRRSPSTKD